MWRIIERIRRCSLARHRDGGHRWTTMDDYDGTLKIKLDPDAYMGSLIYWMGYHSFNEIRLLGKLLQPNMNFVDVGANQGEFTLFAAKRLVHGRVFAFEPLDSIYRLLLENISMNGFQNVTCFPIGLSDAAGSREVFTAEDHSEFRSFHEGLATFYRSGERPKSLGRVESRTLDEVVSEIGIDRLDIMKIDVEGAELPVLRGGRSVLRRFKPKLMLEVNDPMFRAAGYASAELEDLLKSLGYQCFLIRAFGHTTPLSGKPWPSFANILCV